MRALDEASANLQWDIVYVPVRWNNDVMRLLSDIVISICLLLFGLDLGHAGRRRGGGGSTRASGRIGAIGLASLIHVHVGRAPGLPWLHVCFSGVGRRRFDLGDAVLWVGIVHVSGQILLFIVFVGGVAWTLRRRPGASASEKKRETFFPHSRPRLQLMFVVSSCLAT